MAVANDPECLKLERYRDYLLLLGRMQLTRRSGARFDASDLVQATLLKAHAQRFQFRGQSDGEVQAWLRCILAGTLADVFRRERRGKRDVARERGLEAALEQSSGQLLQWLAGPSLSPSQKAMRNELLLEMVKRSGQPSGGPAGSRDASLPPRAVDFEGVRASRPQPRLRGRAVATRPQGAAQTDLPGGVNHERGSQS